MKHNNFNKTSLHISDIENLVSLWEKENPRRAFSLKMIRGFYQYIKKLLSGNESNFFSKLFAIVLISLILFLLGIMGFSVFYVANLLIFKNVELIKLSPLIFLIIYIFFFAAFVIILVLFTLSVNGIISIPRSNEADTSKYKKFDTLTNNTKIDFVELKNFCQIKLDEINVQIDRISKIITPVVIGIIFSFFNSVASLFITTVFNYFQNSINENTLIDTLKEALRTFGSVIILIILFYIITVYLTIKIIKFKYKSDVYISLRDIATSKLVLSS